MAITPILDPRAISAPEAYGLLQGIPGYNPFAAAAPAAAEIAPVAAAAPAAGRLAGLFANGGRLAAGGLGRGGLYALGGTVAAQGVGHFYKDPNSSADEGLKGALQGAGIGAGVGSLIAPGIGTAIGGGVGAIGGGLIGLFGPKHTGQSVIQKSLASETAKLLALSHQLDLDPETAAQIAGQLQATAFNAKSDADVKAASQALAAQLPALQQQQLAQKQDQLRGLAVQAAMQNFTSPYLQQAASSAALSHMQQNKAADEIGGDVGSLLRLHAQQTRSNQDNLLAAYATQIALAPQTQQYQQLQSLRNQANSQLYASLAGQAAGGNGQSNSLAQQIQSLGK